MIKNYSTVVVLLFALCSAAQTPRINFTAPSMYPEGVVYNRKNNSFFVSSVRTGTIGIVDAMGKYTPFYEDSTLKSSFGLKIDEKGSRLWVCTGDPNYSKYADSATYKKSIRLIALDLASGKKRADINLSGLYNGRHFANDITMDAGGNMYITDSYSPVIYKIDTEGKATVFSQSPLFAGGDVGLNGIVVHPGGFLLVANSSNGNLFKVDLREPQQVTKVKLETFFPGADGLLLDGQNNLVLVQNKGVNKVFQLSSTDTWQSAKVTAATATMDRFQYPSTAVSQGGKIYVMNSKLNELTDTTINPSMEFSLQLVQFRPVQ